MTTGVRGSAAAKQALADRIAALGAIGLRAAAVARGIDPDSAGVWAKRGLSQAAFRGPRGVWCVREAELDAELEQWRCGWDGCERYALLSSSGRCHDHAARAEPDGRLTAEAFAAKHGLHMPYLLKRLEAGDVPGQRVDRKGRPVGRDRPHATWRIAELAALRVMGDRFTCLAESCEVYALGPTGYCGACSPAGNAPARALARWPESPGKVRKVCPECGSVREVYPSLQRAGALCARCSMASECRKTTAALLNRGLVPMNLVGSLLYRSPTGLRSLVTPERLQLGRRRRVRLGVNAREVLRLSPHKDARRKLSKPLAALNGTERFGGAPVLTEAEHEFVVTRRVADPVAWSWRKLAERLNEERTKRGEKPVSFMTVKRAVERAMSAAL